MSSKELEIRSKWWTRPVGNLLWLLISSLCLTLRKRLIRVGKSEQILGKQQCIIALWHNRTFTPCYLYRCLIKGEVPMCLLTSASKDGALLATVAARFGMSVVRGSSHRRGVAGFRDMLRELEQGRCMCITPDGPKGPIYKCHPGVIRLASVSGLPVIPVCIDIPSCWRIRKAWDKFVIPKPFSRVTLVAGEPLYVPAGMDDELQKEYMAKLESMMALGRPDFEPVESKN